MYAGAEEPLIPVKVKNETHSSAEYHGKDGFGDRPDVEPKLVETDYTAAVANEPAAMALIKLINKFPSTCVVAKNVTPYSGIFFQMK